MIRQPTGADETGSADAARRQEGAPMTGYAVADLKTTGLFPSGHHKIVEVAVVQVSPWGPIQSSWTTLVNPQRDLGPQHVHGITAADILAAPTFDQISGTSARLSAR